MTREELGNKIKELRLSAGLSVDDLSAKSGISRRCIYNLEKGNFTPKFETLECLTQAMNCEIIIREIV